MKKGKCTQCGAIKELCSGNICINCINENLRKRKCIICEKWTFVEMGVELRESGREVFICNECR
jgi:hypothetical protein